MILEESIAQEIIDLNAKMVEADQLPTQQQLDQYYRNFRQKFGPDRLSALDGEELLLTMHETGAVDSLVYWLEFKNDEEFPNSFGSIAGGSALKYGIYRQKATGKWMTGSPQNQKEITLEEAISYSRKQRDQLLQGVKLLDALHADADDSDYARLQADMNQLAPDVSDTAWGHKYFCMIHPQKLDDYHVAYYQRFQLIRLLQSPPEEDGRYVCAGRYVRISKELGIWLHNLTTVLIRRNGTPFRYWRIGTQDDNTHKNYWEDMRTDGYVALGWPKLGDLAWVEYDQKSKDQLKDLLREKYYPNSPAPAGSNTGKIFNFVITIKDGDLVLAADGAKILGIGKVQGEYSFVEGADWPHRRSVNWLSTEEWTLPIRETVISAVHELRKTPNMLEIEKHLRNTPEFKEKEKEGVSFSSLSGILGRIQDILDRKRQVILYGPPGTGKTFWAFQAANELAARANYQKSFNNLTDQEKFRIVGNEYISPEFVQACTFHPSYGYEDFLEGYRPISANNQLSFQRQDGIFKRICEKAQKQPECKFFLIIDEINRGDIPRIFGELLTILEKNKRGQLVYLPISGKYFSVPENVYIIGTMNTADRSIALLDTALRRRFGFIELMPDTSLLGDTLINGIPLGLWLEALNQRILQSIGRDARNLQIGHAYFLEGGRPVNDLDKFARIIQDDIIPLLEEYCYEDYEALEKILGRGLVDRENQEIREDLFDPTRRDDLIQALLSPSPEIVATPKTGLLEAESLESSETEEETGEAVN